MVVELATNRWSDRMSITLVGFGEDLTLLAPDRITAVAHPGRGPARPGGAGRRGRRRHGHGRHRLRADRPGPRRRPADLGPALPHHGHAAVARRSSSGCWPWPRIRHAAAAGYVVAGDVPGAAWTWEINGQGQLAANQLGFDVQAQMLPPQPARRAGRAVRGGRASRPARPSTPRPRSSVPAAQLVPGAADAGRDHRARPGLRAGARRHRARPGRPGHRAGRLPGRRTPRACTPTCWPARSGRAA